jgi:hypothetical protein
MHPLARSTRLASLLLVAVAAASPSTGAATLNWPGAAPCNGTLQACINAAANGDTIQLAGGATVDEQILIQDKSLTLRGATNGDSRFAAFREVVVAVTGATGRSVTVEGIRFLDGGVRAVHNGTATSTLVVRRVTARRTWNFPAVQATTNSTGGWNATIENCDIEAVSTASISIGGIVLGGLGPGTYRAHFNRVRSTGDTQGAAIRVAGGNANVRVSVVGNRIDGRDFNAGIVLTDGGATGRMNATVVGNVVRNQNGNVGASGALVIDASDGDIDALVFHNTLTDNRRGLSLYGRPDLGGRLSGAVRNNLVAWNQSGLSIQPEYAATLPNSHNLVHGNGSDEFVPGVGTVTTAPRLRPDRFRIIDASPAANAAVDVSADLRILGLPFVDVDGQPRFNGAAPDIGAFETGGARHHLHRDASPNTGNHVSVVGWPVIDGDAAARTLFTPFRNPDGGAGIANPSHTGIYYAGSQWAIFNQGFADMPQGAAFNLVRPDPRHTATHVTTAASQSGFATIIDQPLLNERSDRIVLASPYWTSTYFDSPFAVAYLGPRWLIVNVADAPVPTFVNFFLYAQDPSHAAFRIFATPADVSASAVLVPHPLLDGRPCARVHATQGAGTAQTTRPFSVYYIPAAERWAIVNQDLSPMPAGVEFHVWFDPWQVELCTSGELFRDGFEPS